MSLEVQNKELQMLFEYQKQRNKAKNIGRETVTFCLKFCLYTPFTSSNYILFISHSFWKISKATNALSQNL